MTNEMLGYTTYMFLVALCCFRVISLALVCVLDFSTTYDLIYSTQIDFYITVNLIQVGEVYQLTS